MLLGQVAAGDVAVGLEGGQTRDLTYFECAFELYLTYKLYKFILGFWGFD